MIERRVGDWNLTDLADVPSNGLNVFSCFHCGGGSTMGYKLAGYNVWGGVEIDPKMMALYRTNHHPEHSYLMGIKEFNKLPDEDIPKELFNLDILDGSPPCSSFSTSGHREKGWGKEKKFNEGQALQVLDDLFFDFIDTAEKLRPKAVLAENVKGLIMGKARGYCKEIFNRFEKIGYRTQLFSLNAALMGVPQARPRVFFIATNMDVPKLRLNFNEPLIPFSQIDDGDLPIERYKLSPCIAPLWPRVKPGQSLSTVHPKGSYFNWRKADPKKPLQTLTATLGQRGTLHHKYPRCLTDMEAIRAQTFPLDYNFLDYKVKKIGYVCGMSVPPYMMQRIALEMGSQWFSVGNSEIVGQD